MVVSLRNMKGNGFVFVVLLLCSLSVFGISLGEGQATKEYLILFDESNGQHFTRDMMETSLQALMDVDGLTISITTISDGFSKANVQGADLLIIGNPGEHEEEEDLFNSTERDAIGFFLDVGGSLLVMTNPADVDKNITGRPALLNTELTSLGVSGASFGDINGNASVIHDDYDNKYSNKDYRYISGDLWQNQTVALEPMEIQTAMVFSGFISIGNTDFESIGISSYTSYVSGLRGDRQSYQEKLPFLAAGIRDSELSTNRTSNIVLSGSTIMFSDLLSSEGGKFIDQEDNLALFVNSVLWLLGETTGLGEGNQQIDLNFWAVFLIILVAVMIPIVIFNLYLLLKRPALIREKIKRVRSGLDSKPKKERKRQRRI